MKIVIQRVKEARVRVSDQIVGYIGKGLLIFVGITHQDTLQEVLWLASKCVNLRVFTDDEGKMNRSLLEESGEVLVVSQFTLYGDCKEGRRPSFIQAASPVLAKELYEQFIQEIARLGIKVQTGIFGADMQVSLVNDGPLTLVLERNTL